MCQDWTFATLRQCYTNQIGNVKLIKIGNDKPIKIDNVQPIKIKIGNVSSRVVIVELFDSLFKWDYNISNLKSRSSSTRPLFKLAWDERVCYKYSWKM